MLSKAFLFATVATQQAAGMLVGLSVNAPIQASARVGVLPIFMKQRKEEYRSPEVAAGTDIDVTPAAEEIMGEVEQGEGADDALNSLGSWRISYSAAATALSQARAAQEEAVASQLKAEADFYATLERAKMERAQEVAKWQQVAAEAAETIAAAEAELRAALGQAETEEANAKAAAGQQLAEAEEALQRAVDEAAEEAAAFATAKSRLATALEEANKAAAAMEEKTKADLEQMAEALRDAEAKAAKAKAAAIAAIGNL